MAELPQENVKRVSFKIVVRKVEKPFTVSGPFEELDWICETLGFFEPIDREKTAAAIFREIMKASDSGETLSSSEVAERVGMSRGSVINHLNNLLRSGLIVRYGRYYAPRSRSVYNLIEEIEEDIERIFARMKQTAKSIDDEFGVAGREERKR